MERLLPVFGGMQKPALQLVRTVSLSSIPSCAGGRGISRRNFCLGAGAGLVTLGLPGCDAGSARVGVGGIDDPGAPGTASGPPASAGDAGGDLASNHDLATGTQDGGASDLAHGTSSCPTGGFNAGAASAVALGTAKHLSGSGYNMFLCRDAGGLYALDALCTHEGKLLTKQSSQFYCSAHGATFDLNGQHPTSPAFSPLDHYSVCVDATGQVIVDPNTIVAATTRS